MEKNKSFKNLEKCSLCDSKDFQEFLNLGKIPLGNNLQKSKKNASNWIQIILGSI